MQTAGCLSEAFLEQSPSCDWIVNREGVFCRIYGDPSIIFGKPASELTGRAVSEVLARETATVWRDRFRRALEGETLMLREHYGPTSWHVSVFPIRFEDQVYAGAMAREITAWATAEQELRYTVLSALKAQEFERNTVSRFLHDAVGQNLTAFGLQLDLLRMDLETLSPESCVRIVDVQKLLETMMEEVREYSYSLNPSAVERAGLRSALDRLVTRVRGRFSGTLRLNVDPSLKLDPKIASAMYQIAQEAVENAVQHSGCSSIEIAVKSTRTVPTMEIRDNGRGFDPAGLPGACRGLGLLSMEHYAAEAGLDLAITSTGETGTAIRVVGPEN